MTSAFTSFAVSLARDEQNWDHDARSQDLA